TCYDLSICVNGICTPKPRMTCPNSRVDEGEDCDDGGLNGDSGPATCTTACKFPVCGDGLVHDGEACDGGPGCTPDCTLTTCGYGQLDPGEECEPSGANDPECTIRCMDAKKIMFVSSQQFTGGSIGGIAGGDAKCQTLAEAAGLPGTFKAWLATTGGDSPW